jgi:hypothetical protein
MRDRALILFVGVVVAGIATVLVAAASDQRQLAFTLGVQPQETAVNLAPGDRACQEPVNASAPFDRVAFRVKRIGEAPRIDVEVREVPGNRVLGTGELAGPYPDGAAPQVPVGRVAATDRISVCLSSAGQVGLYGGPAQASRTSTLVVDGRPVRRDLTLIFLRDRPRTALTLLPDMVRRATLFRPGWFGPAALWALLVAVVTLVPFLLGMALRSAR